MLKIKWIEHVQPLFDILYFKTLFYITSRNYIYCFYQINCKKYRVEKNKGTYKMASWLSDSISKNGSPIVGFPLEKTPWILFYTMLIPISSIHTQHISRQEMSYRQVKKSGKSMTLPIFLIKHLFDGHYKEKLGENDVLNSDF